jgi:hypothetical protein
VDQDRNGASVLDLVETPNIVRHSRNRATQEAVILWALASAQYPLKHKVIQGEATAVLIEAVSSFALNARRALEGSAKRSGIKLVQPRWRWVPNNHGEVVDDLWDSLNRIIHAKRLDVGWELLPKVSVIEGGAIVVPYVQAETDRRLLAFIDPLAMSHAFLYDALQVLDRETSLPPHIQ